MCINYTNERLQNLFNNQMINEQQLEYKREGLSWDTIKFSGNDICLEELDKSVFCLLGESTRLKTHTDIDFVNRLKRNKNYNYIYFPQIDPPNNFSIRHFAGDVTYDIGVFCDRNADAVNPELIDLLTKRDII